MWRCSHTIKRIRDVYNGVARIFFFGGPIFRDLRRPTRFDGGGGGSSRKFSGIAVSLADSVGGGGVVAEIFRDRRKPGEFLFFWVT